MTVGQLILALKQLDPDLPIGQYYEGCMDGPPSALKLKDVEVMWRTVYDHHSEKLNQYKDCAIVEFKWGDWL